LQDKNCDLTVHCVPKEASPLLAITVSVPILHINNLLTALDCIHM